VNSGAVGVLPALGSGLTDLRRTGQDDRLLRHDLSAYARAWARVYYFSYFDERLEDFTDDPLLLERVRVVPRRGPWPAKLYALLMPLLHAREFRACEALRVEQFPGVVPAVVAHRLWGVPFVVTYGYHYAEVARIAGSRLKPWLLRRLEDHAFARAAGVVVTSPETEAHVAAHRTRPRLVRVPNGVDTARFAPAPMPADARVVLYVGRLSVEKNVERLLEALALLAPPARLVVVGDGPLRGTLEARARALGVRAEFTGVLPNAALPERVRAAGVFVLPSLTEGHPKALLEAMASGVACAASARGGIPTLLEDGVSGLLFDPERPADIARAIGRLLDDRALAARLGAAARRRAVADFDIDGLLTREVDVVRAVARRDLTALFEDYASRTPMDDPVPTFVAERLDGLLRAGPRAVLDLGGGDGRYLDFCARALPPGARLVACEISAIRAARIRARGFPVVVARAEQLPFRAGAFELVTFLEVIEHTESPALSLDEIRRVLAPGGRLALTTPNYPMKRLYDARAALRTRDLRRLRDDPTHISPLSAPRLARLLADRFAAVHLEGTAILGERQSEWLRRLKGTRLGRRLSNKLFAVCGRSEP
jgi:glycosyltransferase involved in cell wall biosynthesis/SAM-dependent methyltransferase